MSKKESNEFRSALEAAIASFELEPLTEGQIDLMSAHFEMLCKWNHRVNLTRIIQPREASRLHYAEAVFGARFIEYERTMLDIGSGAGFPAIPVAIARPDLEVTALESNQKKSLFLNEVKDALRLRNFSVVTARLEDFDWSGYRLLASRALERAETVFTSIIPALRWQQRLMLFCASDLLEKLSPINNAGYLVEAHAVPLSNDRLVAVFSRIS